MTTVNGESYHPESDVSEDLDGSEEKYYQNLIGVYTGLMILGALILHHTYQ